jgi:amidase
MTALPPFELEEETIKSLRAKMDAGHTSSEKIVQAYLQRIQSIDKTGPTLRAVIELNPDALLIARKMDVELKAGKPRGPLHGIPILVKDNINTADKMQTTAGALALVGNIAAEDSFIIKQLRAAGAVILGKTNLSEWANFRSTKSCSGWSSRGGQTKNPYVLDHNPCGSSSGSGVAVAANLCVVAVGTETDGSIVCPASVNGVVGIKPTVGLVSRSGIIPISKTQDTAGPIARTVTDAAILLGVLNAKDTADGASLNITQPLTKDYSGFLDARALKGKRIGIEKIPQGNNQYCKELLKKALDLLRKQGAEIIEISYISDINKLGDAEYAVLQYEFKDGVNKYLATNKARVKSLKDVIEFNKMNEDKAMPYFKQDILESCETKGGLDSKEYIDSLEASHTGSKRILDKVIAENKLDAICGLTMGPACSIDMIYGDRWGDISLTTPAAISGYPHITVPAGQVYDLPVGLSFFGAPFTEPVLLGIAYAYEQASRKRQKPAYQKAFLP